MTIEKLRKNMSPSLLKKVEYVAARKKIDFNRAILFLIRGVVSPSPVNA